MNILVVLQTMYSGIGVDVAAPIIFRINPKNKSGKKMLEICDGENNNVYFSNISSICAGGGADSIRPRDVNYMKRALELRKWDLVIYGGGHSKKAYMEHFHGKVDNVILMPHPAARNFSNNLKEDIKDYIQQSVKADLKAVAEFRQLKDKVVEFNFVNK